MEYLIPTNNVIVLDSYFNLTINLISLTDFNTILWSFGSGWLFLGHPVYCYLYCSRSTVL